MIAKLSAIQIDTQNDGDATIWDVYARILLQDSNKLRNSISGLVVEYIVAIDVTRVRFPADAILFFLAI